jgi:hypothetical protein
MLMSADCFRPPCSIGHEGGHGECIVYFEGQEHITLDIDKALDLYADHLQQILMNIDMKFTDTAIVRTCATPDLIRSNLGQLKIEFVAEHFACEYLGKPTLCLGSSLYGVIELSWEGSLSSTALAHELNHWVDELCGVAIDYPHARTDWWSTEELMDSVFKANGL